MKTNLIYSFIALIVCVAITSCKKSAHNPEVVFESNLIKSADKHAALIEKRNGRDDPFTIETIQRNGNMLIVTLTGGCNQDDFHAVWDGSIMYSNPGQINLVLYNKSEEHCETEKQFDVTINLNKVLRKRSAIDFIFNVANGSKKQDKSLNPNGSVTTK